MIWHGLGFKPPSRRLIRLYSFGLQFGTVGAPNSETVPNGRQPKTPSVVTASTATMAIRNGTSLVIRQ